MERQPVSICWLRRDLRLTDNAALYHAFQSNFPVLLVFIFDVNILDKLENKADRRVAFIHECLQDIQKLLLENKSSLEVFHSSPVQAFKSLFSDYEVKEIFTNTDYEPYAIARDAEIKKFAESNRASFFSFKDQVIFEKSEVLKQDGNPYTVYSPYSKSWKNLLQQESITTFPSEKYAGRLFQTKPKQLPSLSSLGFKEIKSNISKPEIDKDLITHYALTRDLPSIAGTTHLGVHLRFGTLSIRNLVLKSRQWSETFLNELIWREFFMMIVYHFPEVENNSFHKKYDRVHWRNNEREFELWCAGKTGFPLVDAGMRQLNETGWMHNRVRMVVASFLTKDLLIDWRWGEAYFASKLLDYELASNNGNWQWAAGTGCDAAPYFRIFNPVLQRKKFDPEGLYIRQWIKNYDSYNCPPIVDHHLARKRALEAYQKALA